MAEKENRLYIIDDDAIIARAQTTQQFLADKLALFTAKFPWIDAAFAAAFQADITAAKNSNSNTNLGQGKKVLTEDIVNTMDEGWGALQVLDTYAGLAYPQDAQRRTVFGQKEWRAARNNRKKMFDALTQAYSLASQDPYKTELGNKGFTLADANSLRDLAALLDEKKIPQVNAANEKRILTADRIALHNKVFETMRTLRNCAQLVFRDDATARKRNHCAENMGGEKQPARGRCRGEARTSQKSAQNK
jgi:hypothetical protein